MMKNITFLTGYYGSGKTEIAVNLAIQKKFDMVVDLDIINPYFRSRELEEELKEYGIKTISSDLDYKSHIDLPYISKKIFIPFHNQKIKAVFDLGGNDLGAKLLRQFKDYTDRAVDLFIVVNVFRQETSNATKIIELINKIEGMGGFLVTGLINNTNLLKETTLSDILEGQNILKEVSLKTGLEIKYTSIWENFDFDTSEILGEVIKIKLFHRKDWI